MRSAYATTVAVTLLASSCGNPADNKINSMSQPAASNGARTSSVTPGSGSGDGLLGGGSGPKVNLEAIEGKSVLDAKYDIKVKAAGFDFCDGSARLLINVPSKDATSPNAKPLFDVKCISLNCAIVGKIVDGKSLNGLLGGAAAGNVQPAAAGENPVKIDDKYIQILHLGTTRFDPPMVIFPNFAGAKPDFLRTLDETRNLNVADTADANKSGSGTQTLKTIIFQKPYANPLMPTTKFTDVFQFKLTNDGFDGVDRIKSALLETLEVRVNLDPIAVISMHVETKASDLMALLGQKDKKPPPDAPWDPECGPPPEKAPAGGGGLGGLLGGALGGGGDSGGGSGGLLGGLLGGGGGGGSIIGTIAGLVTKLIVVQGDVVLTDQKGLKEAFEKNKEFDDLMKSQTSGGGS